jgi:hypothetical protein
MYTSIVQGEDAVPAIEYVTVADHAEALNGKLYIQGAGWTDLYLPQAPEGRNPVMHVGIAASILVGWNETNRRFPLTLRLLHEDGDELLKLSAQVEAGRPAGIPPGSDLRNMIAVGAQLQFPKVGTYELRAELGDEPKTRSVTFRVHAAARPTGPLAIQMPSA